MAEIVIYSTQSCPYCVAAKRFLKDAKKVPFREVDLSGDNAGRMALVEKTGMRTVPQIFVGETHIGGYDDMRALDAEGGLEPLLAQIRG